MTALLNPTFSEFTYFFLMDVIGVSKFIFAVVVLVGQICHIIGALMYKSFCRDVEARWLVFFGAIAVTFSTFLAFVFAKRWNLEIGIPDMVFLFFTDVVFNTIIWILVVMPLMALFAKITPKKIEGTIFAFLTGTWNLGSTVIQPQVGNFINHQFVGVNKNDLSGYPTLMFIAFVFSFFNYALLFLVPMRKQLKMWKKIRNRQEEKRLEERKAIREKKQEEEEMLLKDNE